MAYNSVQLEIMVVRLLNFNGKMVESFQIIRKCQGEEDWIQYVESAMDAIEDGAMT